ncbi:tripartite tricarboxylate transporter permease [Streptomyces sedi]|uniref:Tripartite tricarboxylate transporter permease n=1 Tax=Streptomyces sedi TaxID=555059 RepID=A0A5C4UV25_9ACTN|nr:tripartite tricarboxylate transporter permease [Streptomyces sedi]TNM27531.1 tripartite tricarboxylate transporter permease [Streptomyces sedi]
MDTFSLLGDGFAQALTPLNLLLLLVGAVLGTAVGVLPGLGSAMAVALLLPVTFGLDPTGAFIMFAGVYYGGLFGDSTAGILLNTPGNSSAIAASIEGHRMALAGRAPQALATAAIGAFTGGLIATTLMVFLAPRLVDWAALFGPAEYFALAVFAFAATATIVADSPVKGCVSLAIGLSLALVGVDPTSGATRFTLDQTQLFDGIAIVVITVGLLALGEVLHVAARGRRGAVTAPAVVGRPWLSRADVRLAWPAWLRGTGFGVPFGVIPVGGSEMPTFLAYSAERRLDRRRARPRFGRGAIQGVAGPEAAGSATAGSAMGALLALGLPTSATAAIMLAGFQQYGMQPGPLLFERNADLVWTLLASLFLGIVVLLILNLPFAPLWAKLLLIPRHHLYAGITVCCGLGVYATGASTFDLVLVLAIGLLGLLMRRHGLPLAPVLIGVILGPLAETELRRALAVSENDVMALFDSGITRALYGLLLAGLVLAVVTRLRARARRRAAEPVG